MTAGQLVALATLVGIAAICWIYSSVMKRVTGAQHVIGRRSLRPPQEPAPPAGRHRGGCQHCARMVATFKAHVDQMLAMVDPPAKRIVDHPDRYDRLIDPGDANTAAPEYNAEAEWFHNIHPSLRKDQS